MHSDGETRCPAPYGCTLVSVDTRGKPLFRVKAWRRPNEDGPVLRVIIEREPVPRKFKRLLELTRQYKMTDAEREAQRRSWARQMKY